MSLTVTPGSFRLAQAFTISRGSRTEARVLTLLLGGPTLLILTPTAIREERFLCAA